MPTIVTRSLNPTPTNPWLVNGNPFPWVIAKGVILELCDPLESGFAFPMVKANCEVAVGHPFIRTVAGEPIVIAGDGILGPFGEPISGADGVRIRRVMFCPDCTLRFLPEIVAAPTDLEEH